jgi:hypothetical protein
MARRITDAEQAFVATVARFGEISEDEAFMVMLYYRKIRLLKHDYVSGVISVRHGAFLDRKTIRSAVRASRGLGDVG